MPVIPFIPAIIGGVASIGGAVIASGAAGHAADVQAQAATTAAELQKQAAEESIAEQRRQFDINQANQLPWLRAGQGAVTTLAGLGPPAPWAGQFQAPTDVTEKNDPGFQFRLAQGQQALERSAAARGGLLSGGTAKAIQRYAQDYASNEYGNVYNRALGEYQQAYNIFNQNQAKQYGYYQGLAGEGQTTAATLGQQGQQSAANISNIMMGSAAQQGQAYQNAAAARASGYAAGANAWGSAFGNIANIAQTIPLYSMMQNQSDNAAFNAANPYNDWAAAQGYHA